VVAHFHYVLSLGAVFTIFRGLVLLFPKITGYMYEDRIGRPALLVTFVGVTWCSSRSTSSGSPACAPLRRYPDAYHGGTWCPRSDRISRHRRADLFYGMVRAFIRKERAANNPWGPGATTSNGRCRRRRRSTSSTYCRWSSEGARRPSVPPASGRG